MKKAILAFLVGFVLLSSACIIAVVDPSSAGQGWLKSQFHKSLSLEPGGSVTLENINGNIVVSGWEKDAIEISAEGSMDSPQEAGIHFLGWRFSPPDVRVRSTADSVRIRTGESRSEDERNSVDYVLRVPRSVNLDSIRNGRGRIAISDIYGRSLLDADEGEIRISNYSGSLDVRLGSGVVEAEALDLRPQDSVHITVERGDIVLLLEPSVAAQLVAAAPEGNIFSELELDQTLPAKKISAKLGDGQASIELTAVQGDIRIRKVKEAQ